MARLKRNKKTQEVQKFGGVDDLGGFLEKDAKDAPVKDVGYDVKSIETQSKTTLQMDEGHGTPIVIRVFDFALNPEMIQRVNAGNMQAPTKQELFNSHVKGIELSLWKDGFTIEPAIAPQIMIDGDKYTIFIGAKLMSGQTLRERPMTLSQIANG